MLVVLDSAKIDVEDVHRAGDILGQDEADMIAACVTGKFRGASAPAAFRMH